MSHLTLTIEIYPFVTSHAIRINCAKARQVPARHHIGGHPSTETQGWTLLNSSDLLQNSIYPLDSVFCLDVFPRFLFFANFVIFLEQCWRAKLSRFTQQRSFWLTMFVFNLLIVRLTTVTVSYMNWSKFRNLNCFPNLLFKTKANVCSSESKWFYCGKHSS